MIQIADLKPGYLYRLNARNIRMGIWNPDLQGGKGAFIGIRTKFGNRYLDRELHHDADPHFGTATPTEELGVCPLEEKRDDLGTVCGRCEDEFNIQVPVKYLPYTDGPRTVTYLKGKLNEYTVTYTSGWQHTADGGKCTNPHGRRVSNDALFRWLEQLEKEFPDAER